MKPDQSLAINELFYSIQGESSQAGRPSSFVRLMGCPLRCRYCDSEYAFFEGKKLRFDEIIDFLDKQSSKLVLITGGEPLSQAAVIKFMQILIEQNFELMLETSGALPIDKVPPEVRIILDIKTPGSGELEKMYWDNLGFLKAHKDEIKFVVTNEEDFSFAVDVSSRYRLFEKHVVLISPEHEKADRAKMASLVLASELPFRFQLQTHKYIWPGVERGV